MITLMLAILMSVGVYAGNPSFEMEKQIIRAEIEKVVKENFPKSIVQKAADVELKFFINTSGEIQLIGVWSEEPALVKYVQHQLQGRTILFINEAAGQIFKMTLSLKLF